STAVLSANNGSILLQNTNQSGTIVAGAFSTMHGSSTKAGVGQVSLIIGTLDPKQLHSITSIANGTINSTGGAKVLVGPNSVQSNPLANVLNAFGRNVT